MPDRTSSPAYAALPLRARRVFAAIELAIGDGTSASVSFTEFQFDHHIGRPSISPSVKLLHAVGLIEIAPGSRASNIFRLSNRWRTIDEVEAVRLAALAREVLPGRRFEKRREPKPVSIDTDPEPSPRVDQFVNTKPTPRGVGAPKPVGERPRVMQRRVPSLPTMPWVDDGR